jgi:hypothetical protein
VTPVTDQLSGLPATATATAGVTVAVVKAVTPIRMARAVVQRGR